MTWKDPNKEPPPINEDVIILISYNNLKPYPEIDRRIDNGIWMKLWEPHEKIIAWMPIPENPKWIKPKETNV